MKKNLLAVVLVIFAVMFIGHNAWSLDILSGNLFSTKVEIVSFQANPDTGDLNIVARVCPAYLWGSLVSGTSMRPKLLQAIGQSVNQWKRTHPEYTVRRTSFDTALETSLLRSASSGNRCTGGTAMYSITVKQQPAATTSGTADLTIKPGVIKVGVRDKFPMVSVKNGNSWDGAAILFAEAVARRLGAKILFVELPSAPKCLKATKYRMVDLSISLISYTADRAKEYNLSEPYFKTGIVAATLNPATLKQANLGGFNSSEYTAFVAEGTTAEKLVRERFSKMKIKTVTRTPDVYEEAKKTELKNKDGKFTGVIMVTDEVIALTWPGSFVIEHSTRLFTHDSYVAVAGNPKLASVINSVIKTDNIPGMYIDLVGR